MSEVAPRASGTRGADGAVDAAVDAAEAGAAAAGTAAGYGLRPRPEPGPAIVALVAAAVDAVWPRPALPKADDAANPVHRAWRFSGRWWSRPVAVRRDRPWVG